NRYCRNPIACSELGLELFSQGFSAPVFHEREGSRTAAGHQGGGRAIAEQEFLKQPQQRILLECWSLQRIVKLGAGSFQVGAPQQGNQFLSSIWLAIQGGGKARKLGVSPGSRDAKTRMHHQKGHLLQCREKIESLDVLAAANSQRWSGLQQ